jgi:hypothetical protein
MLRRSRWPAACRCRWRWKSARTATAVPWQKVAAAVTPRTRLIVINSPHNPTGSVLRRADLDQLAAIVAGTQILVLSDEVYEHMVYDGEQHASVSSHPQLAERAFVVSSFGKTYHVTGWKVGYVAAPAALSAEFRKVHQYNVFTVNTPMQHGLAAYMADPAALPRPVRRFTSASATCSAPGWRRRACACCRRTGLISSAWIQRRVGPARGAVRAVADDGAEGGGDSRVGVLHAAARSRGSCASALRRPTRRCNWRWID